MPASAAGNSMRRTGSALYSGARRRGFYAKQRQIAAEMATLAASGWATEPQPRKAVAGREIINLAIENGVLETETA